MADAAAQKDSGKQLVTIFVGKFLRTANNIKVDEDGLVIYFNGNDRAIPPDRLPKMNLLETAHGYGIYGSSANRKAQI